MHLELNLCISVSSASCGWRRHAVTSLYECHVLHVAQLRHSCDAATDCTIIMIESSSASPWSLRRFKRQLPKYATRFIEMCVMLCADHGPAVSGAMLLGCLSMR